VLVGIFFRFHDLDNRPMHGDEANQAVKTGILLDEERYEYDPHDHHGPTLYYLGLLSAKVGGHSQFSSTDESTYRFIPAIFGSLLVVMTFWLCSTVSRNLSGYGVILLALSPAFVFYSRYYVQETLLVVFTLASILAGLQYAKKPTAYQALILGVNLSLMHATKETAVLAYAAMGAALVVTFLYFRSTSSKHDFTLHDAWKRHVFIGLGAALAVNIVFYTSFFTHARGPLDSILTYGNYLVRAEGAGMHDKPFFYYLSLLAYTKRGPGPWWSEGIVLALALWGFIEVALQCKKKTVTAPILFIGIYTIALTFIYSIIPYKTPWSMLSFYFGIIVMAGFGFATITERRLHTRPLVVPVAILFFFAASGHLGYQSWQVTHRYNADPRNPYVYAHTSSAFMKLAERFEGVKAVHPDPENMLVQVYQPDADYWPIPWYLRDNPNSGFWSGRLPDNMDADIIVSAPELQALLKEKLKGEYFKEMHGLRPSVLRHVYIRQDLWDRFMEGRQ
jgi:uncharacterized protein (TIGR03663 family)